MNSTRMLLARRVPALTAILVCSAILIAQGPAGSPAVKSAAVVLLAIGLWVTGWLPEWLTGLIFFTLCMVGRVAPAGVVFAGFTSSATWLVFSGAVIGAAIMHTGLGDRLAGRLADTIGPSLTRAIAAVAGFGLLLGFVMPSAMGRVMLMLPILQALAARFGYAEGSRGQRGIMLAGIFGTFLPTFSVLPANIPNNVFVGTVEALLGTPPTYGAYLWLHFPVLGLCKAGILTGLVLWLYRDASPQRREKTDRGRMSRAEMHLAFLLLAAVGAWATDVWHGIPAAWVGMIVAVWCLFPGCGLLGPRPFSALRFEPIFYVAAIVSMGVIAHHGGLGALVADRALAMLPLVPDAPAQTFGLLSGLSGMVGLLVTQPGIPPVMTSLAPSLAHATGWSVQAVCMTQVLGFSTVLLPYQAPPLVVAIQSGGLGARDVTRLCLLTAVLTVLILWPLDYLWWGVAGWIG